MALRIRLKRLMTWALFVSGTALAEQPPLTLDVVYPNGEQQQYSVPPGTRLTGVIKPLLSRAGEFDWVASRIGSQQLQYDLQGMIEQARQHLNAIERYARGENNAALVQAAQQLQQQLQHSDFYASYYLGIPWQTMRLQQGSNPVLADNQQSQHFRLKFAQRSAVVEWFGVTQNPGTPVLQSPANDNRIQKLLRQHPPGAAAEPGFVWQINSNGSVAHRPVANYNSHKLARCYDHRRQQPLALANPHDCPVPAQLTGGTLLYIGLDESELPQQLTGINELMVRILKHYDAAGRNE
ncbi:capsule biosynthesis GfcC D2 domain-containing protein [Idiomarina aquatica]|nr:capsule biosynthesis GfcC D2 domain-containing protein [Idiomarina aquatica]